MGFTQKTTTRIVILVLIASLVPLGGVLFLSTSTAGDALQTEATERLGTEVSGLAQNTENIAEASVRQTEILSEHREVRELMEMRESQEELDSPETTPYPDQFSDRAAYQNANEYLHLVGEDPAIIRAVVYWKDGHSIAGYGPEGDVKDYRGEMLWFRETMDESEVKNDEIRVSAMSLSRATGDAVIRYTAPIVVNGERVGVVLIAYDASAIIEEVSDLQVGEEGFGMMVAPDYRTAEGDQIGAVFVAHGQDPDLTFDEENADNLHIPSDELTGEQGEITFEYSDKQWHAEYEKVVIGDQTYYVLATVPTTQMLAAVHNIRDQGLLIGTVAGIGIVILTIVLTRRLTKPLEALTDDATAIARGNLNREITQSAVTHEIDQLTNAVSTMKANLEGTVGQLEATSSDLREGRLDEAIETDYPGVYGEMLENIDEGVTAMKESLTEIQAASSKLAAGRLDSNISTDKPGRYGEVLADLAEAIDQLEQSFDQIVGASEQLREGDFRSEFETDYRGVYGEVLSNLESGFDDVNHSLGRITRIADQVVEATEVVSASSKEVETASQEVAESVQEISEGATGQRNSLNEAASELNNLSATVQEIASSATQVAERSNQAAEIGRDGEEKAAEVQEGITRIESEADSAVDEVARLAEELDAIGEIVQLIDDIAEQTNLLALNASIEAERAGSAGEGFAVVAEEVKSLAEETKQNAGEIEEKIDAIQASASDSVQNIRGMQKGVEERAQTIEEAVEIFGDIAESIGDVESGAEEISDATDDQAASTEEVAAMVDEVSGVSEETAGEAETVSAATEEQTASLGQIGENIEDLTERIAELDELLNQFSIKTAAKDSKAGERAESQQEPDSERAHVK